MEYKKKVELLRTTIKQLIEDEKGGSSSADSFVAVVKDGDEADDDRRLLSKLLSQLESLEEDGMLDEKFTDEKVDSPEVGEKCKSTNEACCCSSEVGKEEIVKELRKVRRQNLVKEGLTHPFKSLGGVVKGMLKRPSLNGQEVEKQASPKHNPIVQAAALPGLNIPKLPRVEIPAFEFDSDEE